MVFRAGPAGYDAAHKMNPTSLLAMLTALCVTSDTPRELGAITWGRELEPALETSTRSGRPILLLFQEIPG